MARKLPEKPVRLTGQMFLDLQTGEVSMKYGAGGWFKMKMGNVKGTDAFRVVRETYGTKTGASNRRKLALAIIRNVRFSKPGNPHPKKKKKSKPRKRYDRFKDWL